MARLWNGKDTFPTQIKLIFNDEASWPLSKYCLVPLLLIKQPANSQTVMHLSIRTNMTKYVCACSMYITSSRMTCIFVVCLELAVFLPYEVPPNRTLHCICFRLLFGLRSGDWLLLNDPSYNPWWSIRLDWLEGFAPNLQLVCLLHLPRRAGLLAEK